MRREMRRGTGAGGWGRAAALPPSCLPAYLLPFSCLPRAFLLPFSCLSPRCSTRCSRCQRASPRPPEPFYELQCVVQQQAQAAAGAGRGGSSSGSSSSVEASLAALLAPEELSGDNAYACEACAARTTATRYLTIDAAPPVLNLQARGEAGGDLLTLRERVPPVSPPLGKRSSSASSTARRRATSAR